MRLGLCCAFMQEKIKFRTTTARSLSKQADCTIKIKDIVSHNIRSLEKAIRYCSENNIGCFRVTSQILPLKTHPEFGYDAELLGELVASFCRCGDLAKQLDVRLTFHPDQFVVLNSPRSNVVTNSVRELEYHAEVASWIGADVINIHAGGMYGDKESALNRLKHNISRLSDEARSRVTIENDDRIYSPADLIPVCLELEIPFVYDIHHHRFCSDDLGVDAATKLAIKTWNREPLFHISSPKWGRPHADYIRVADFPPKWLDLDCTVEVEAKAKELAIIKLASELK